MSDLTRLYIRIIVIMTCVQGGLYPFRKSVGLFNRTEFPDFSFTALFIACTVRITRSLSDIWRCHMGKKPVGT